MATNEPSPPASAGHKLGQLVGDWFEEHFSLPLLQEVATRLRLYLDHRFRTRAVRGDKILWADDEGNEVDYDFVLELDGSDDALGIPVAFFETFWRRGSRHSKDKARDDSGKLRPMRALHPTARFLGIVGGGDFTAPARQLVQSLRIDLFYVPKAKIITAFSDQGLTMDYPDRAPETVKAQLAGAFASGLTPEVKLKAAQRLRELVGPASINSYVDRVRSALGALPQEIRFIARKSSAPAVFETIPDATTFLASPQFDFPDTTESFVYQITYTDGSEFERPDLSFDELNQLHRQIEKLADHVTALQGN